MNTVTKWITTLALAVGPIAVQAQTYDLDITMTAPAGYLSGFGVQGSSVTFMGSFVFNGSGTCFGSASSCAVGTTPDFTHVNISDPLGGGMFTLASGSSGELDLVDQSPSSLPIGNGPTSLSFDLNAPLGGSKPTIGISNETYVLFPNSTGIFGCGFVFTPEVTCSKAALTTAPEIDPASAGAALTLLLGGLLVLRGRGTVEKRAI
jgi:hypothetical protein